MLNFHDVTMMSRLNVSMFIYFLCDKFNIPRLKDIREQLEDTVFFCVKKNEKQNKSLFLFLSPLVCLQSVTVLRRQKL